MPQLTPEYIYSEKPTIDQLIGMGWQYIAGSWDNPQVTGRENFKQVLISDRLKTAIKRINLDDNGTPWLDDTQVNAAASQLERLGAQRLMEANQTATELLLKGTTILGQDGKQHTVHFIDFEHPENNDFLAINQYRVDPPWATGNRGFIVPDIVLFVNGIPLVVIECKSPNLDHPITEAIRDLLQYSNQRGSSQPEGAEKLFHYNQLTIAASAKRAAAGTIGANYEHYVEWKDTTPRPIDEIVAELGITVSDRLASNILNSRQMLVAGMLHPANLLDILQNFTLFKTTGGRTIKIVPRYQQYRAVYKTIELLINRQNPLNSKSNGGIIWHTQGSGKSLTMVYLIRKIRTIPALRRFKIVVVTDRTDLEKQLSDTAILTGEPLQRAKTVKKLEDYLKQPGAGLIFGTIQKFKGGEDAEEEEQIEAIQKNLNPSPDILILIDEAHRSHASILHANLLEALPNCVRIGFTGTPIVKAAKKTTQQIFGNFIDRYNIRQSQEDSVTLPILYEGLEARGAVTSGDDLDKLFDIIFHDKTPEERAQIKAKYATKTQVSEARVPIETLEKVVGEKRLWIYSKLLKKESLNLPTAVKKYVSGEKFYYLGRSYRLKLIDSVKGQPSLRLYQSRFELQREAQARGREEFIKWYGDRLPKILDTQIAVFVKHVGASPHFVQVRELGYRWGSCGHKGDLCFHWRVAMLPPAMIEYVVVHELVHLIEPHHEREFWDKLAQILPDFEERKRFLAENGVNYDL